MASTPLDASPFPDCVVPYPSWFFSLQARLLLMKAHAAADSTGSRGDAVKDKSSKEEGCAHEGSEEHNREDDDAGTKLSVAARLLDRLEAIQKQVSGSCLLLL